MKNDYSERKYQMEEEINLLVSLITTKFIEETNLRNDEKLNKQVEGVVKASSSKKIGENPT